MLYGHFNSVNITLPSPWAENIFPFIYISSISFISILWFSVYRSFPSLVKFIPKHFILSDAILKFIFPRWFSGKESICQAGDLSSIPGSGRYPGEGHGNPLQYSSLGDLIDRGAWVGYSPWGLKESGTSQWLNSNSSKVVYFILPKNQLLVLLILFYCIFSFYSVYVYSDLCYFFPLLVWA